MNNAECELLGFEHALEFEKDFHIRCRFPVKIDTDKAPNHLTFINRVFHSFVRENGSMTAISSSHGVV